MSVRQDVKAAKPRADNCRMTFTEVNFHDMLVATGGGGLAAIVVLARILLRG